MRESYDSGSVMSLPLVCNFWYVAFPLGIHKNNDVDQEKKCKLQPTQDLQTGTYPKESVLSLGQLSSSTARLFLDLKPDVTLTITTGSIWLGPKAVVLNTFETLQKCFPPKGQHQMTIKKMISFTRLITTPHMEQCFSAFLLDYLISHKYFPVTRSQEAITVLH